MAENTQKENGSGKTRMTRKGKYKTVNKHQNWTLAQKKKLMSLLYEYPLDAYRNIASKIKGKDEKQVKEFIKKIKLQAKNSHQRKKTLKKDIVKKAPLVEWLEIATDMVEFESVDNSSNLTKVLSIISHFEDFETPPAEDEGDGPNYKSIYKYLSQVLQADRHDDLESLGPIESAIVLDLLHNLMEVLSDFDKVVQRNVIKWKYQLMDVRDENCHTYPELLKRASENDFTEFIEEVRMSRYKDKEHERRYVARLNKRTLDDKAKEGKSSVASRRKSLEQTLSVTSNKSTQEASTSRETLPNAGIDIQTDSEVEVGIEADTIENKMPVIKRHKPGRKSSLIQPEVPYTEIVLVMPPKGAEIVNYNPRTKKGAQQRTDGKYQSLDPDEELVHNDFSREITYDVHRTELNQFMKKRPKEKSSEIIDIEKKYDRMMKKEEERRSDITVKKPKLYSINPFCLPVTLLDLKPLHSS